MIVALNIKNEYGKQGTVGVNLMSELNGDGNEAYAHSMEQAVAWVKSHALFATIEPHSLHDGRFVFNSEWTPKNDILDMLYGYDDATHVRQTIVVYPVNTVFENVGYH
jgi:hypothetical protein